MENPHSILIVDDDPRICRLVARHLSREGYSVRTASSGEEMRRRIAEEQPQLVILDLMLPDEDGFSLAREIRAESNVGIVMLTGKTDTVDKIVGLEIGADDYVTKPFDERELVARVRSVLRRMNDDASEKKRGGSIACFEGWTLDLKGYDLTSPDGEPVHLTSHEFQLLSALVTHTHCVLTRDTILDLVSGRDWDPDDRSIDVLVGKLRKKIEADPHNPKLIKTIRGAGYKLTAKITFPAT
jgi:two-component system phosphate regulon response regulator OmpR